MKSIILIVFIGSSLLTTAQTKIGSITIADSVAKAYFLDCYNHPDTVKKRTVWDYNKGGCTNCAILTTEWDRWQKQADEFNENLLALNIGEARDTVYYPASKDTIYNNGNAGLFYLSDKSRAEVDSIIKMKRIVAIKSGIKQIIDMPAGSNIVWLGYLIPRKPSEQDFVKWYASRYR